MSTSVGAAAASGDPQAPLEPWQELSHCGCGERHQARGGGVHKPTGFICSGGADESPQGLEGGCSLIQCLGTDVAPSFFTTFSTYSLTTTYLLMKESHETIHEETKKKTTKKHQRCRLQNKKNKANKVAPESGPPRNTGHKLQKNL